MTLDKEFQQYFQSLDRAGNEDRCFLCRRTPSDVKAFFGFHEDGTPIDAEAYGLEDVVLDPSLDIMSYHGSRPLCAVCQLNFETLFMSPGGREVLERVFKEIEDKRDELWPPKGPSGQESSQG